MMKATTPRQRLSQLTTKGGSMLATLLRNFPRRATSLTIELEEQNSTNQAWMPVTAWRVPNPKRISRLPPIALVTNQSFHGFEMTIRKAQVARGTNRLRRDGSVGSFEFSVTKDGQPRGDWELKDFAVQDATGKPFPQDPWEQLYGGIGAVFGSWMNKRANTYRRLNNIPDHWGTAVNVQAMVFGNMGDTSGTGVGFTRNPATGEHKFYGEFLMNAQGEDVVAGIRTPQPIAQLREILPQAYDELVEITTRLEKYYRDMQDFEFTVQEGTLYMLQTRSGKRTGPAAVRIAVEMCAEGMIAKEEAVMRVDPDQLDQLLHPLLEKSSLKSLTLIGKGLAASPGAAVGKVVFDSDHAVNLAGKFPLILVRKETSPDDIHGMDVSKGIVTMVGGLTSHAAVVARGMGKPCIVGASTLKVDEKKGVLTTSVNGKTVTVKEGDWLSIDGTTGEVFLGQASTVDPDTKSGFLAKFMVWVDESRGGFNVRTNAETPRDAKKAREFGAEGIGLCRTEHMFFEEGRVEHVQAMILANDEKSRRKALAKLLPMQRKDFEQLFTVMDGYPVVIRTLDPPLHEFLPKREHLMVDIARFPHADIKEKREMAKLLQTETKELKKLLPTLLHRVEE
ncbi:MAG: pyruvate, phosphate dikinase, partial [Rhodospirillales bacterium]|nr:pyruvate, phosphate dikinase [Rhodospirillales bacterium]